MLWPVLGVGQLDADLLDQEAGPVCPTATQVSGLAEENGILLLYWPALLLFVCFFFPFLQHPRLRLAAMQLLPSFTKFHEVLSEGISVNTLLLGGIVPSCVIHPLSSTHSAVSWIHP